MTKSEKIKALTKIENYENSIVIHNEFSDDIMADRFQSDLMDYAEQNAAEYGGDWINFKKLIDEGTLDWTHTDYTSKIYLQDTVNIDVIVAINKSRYSGDFGFIVIDLSELEEKHREMLLIDAIWKVYNYRRSFETSRYIREIETALRTLADSSREGIFEKVTFEEIENFVKGIENFDEQQIKLWIKLK